MDERIFVAAVVGPTASGKTSLGIGLAKAFDGEIVSCDSMQIYQGLEIGTAKPSRAEQAEVPHHMIGTVPVTQSFSLSDYIDCAEKVIAGIAGRNKLPVLVGGTGLYARSLLQGSDFSEESRNDSLRIQLWEQAEQYGVLPLYEKLRAVDPVSAEKIHPNNVKRLVRALEYHEVTGKPISQQETKTQEREDRYRYSMICLDFRDRQTLYRRIHMRVDRMLEQGLLLEAETFFNQTKQSAVLPTAAQAIGYKELFPYFKGEVSLGVAVENLKQATRNYAKRQGTWFRREKNAAFLFVDDYQDEKALLQAAKALIQNQGK